MEHESVQQMWKGYLESIGENQETTNLNYTSWHFCDNEQDLMSWQHWCYKVLKGQRLRYTSLMKMMVMIYLWWEI